MLGCLRVERCDRNVDKQWEVLHNPLFSHDHICNHQKQDLMIGTPIFITGAPSFDFRLMMSDIGRITLFELCQKR